METFWNLFDNTVVFLAMIALIFVWPIETNKSTFRYKLIMGITVSIMAVFIMLNSVSVGNGLYIDARYAIPIIAFIFFGTIPGVMATVSIIVSRILLLGGAGVPIGVTFAVFQGAITYFYAKYYYSKQTDQVQPASIKLMFFSFGQQCILLMLAFVFLPYEIALESVRVNAFYLLTIYPIIVLIFSLIVGYRQDYYRKLQEGVIKDKFFETILHRSPTPIVILDSDGIVLHANEAWIDQGGYTLDDFSTIFEWMRLTAISSRVYSDKYETIEDFVQANTSKDYRIKTKSDGRRTWNIVKKEAGVLPNGNKYYVFVGKDITDRKKYEKTLINISYHDFLTGLYNRRYYDEVFSKNTVVDSQTFVIYGDMNDLKSVNDYYGHSKGDEAIQTCSNILKKQFGKNSTIFRFGGDEFLIIIQNITKDEVLSKITDVDKELESFDFGQTSLGITLGVHRIEGKQTLNHGIMKAESRMYEYKIFESKSARSGTVDVILTMLFEKDPETERHSKRVQEICRVFLKALDLNTSQTSLLLRSALLHDIGKILIPTSILLSKNELNEEEYEIIKNHSYLGYRILASKEQLKSIGDIVLAHHERVDGKGYPNNLKGDHIPFEARVLHIVDAYEAMTSNRTYAAKKSTKEAIAELKRCSGTQFDADLVDRFISVIPEIPDFLLDQ